MTQTLVFRFETVSKYGNTVEMRRRRKYEVMKSSDIPGKRHQTIRHYIRDTDYFLNEFKNRRIAENTFAIRVNSKTNTPSFLPVTKDP